jgi:hypothetical protein
MYYTHTNPSIPIPKGTKSQLLRTEPSQPAITVGHQNSKDSLICHWSLAKERTPPCTSIGWGRLLHAQVIKSQPHRIRAVKASHTEHSCRMRLVAHGRLLKSIVDGPIYAPPRALRAGPQGCFNSTPRALQAGPQGGYTTPYTLKGPAYWAATANKPGILPN